MWVCVQVCVYVSGCGCAHVQRKFQLSHSIHFHTNTILESFNAPLGLIVRRQIQANSNRERVSKRKILQFPSTEFGASSCCMRHGISRERGIHSRGGATRLPSADRKWSGSNASAFRQILRGNSCRSHIHGRRRFRSFNE